MKKEIISVLLALILLGIIGFSIFGGQDPSLTGLVIYEGSCGSSINESGFWELNSTNISCASGNALKIEASDVIFECNGNYISGGLDENSTGVEIDSDLTNVTIQNCNIENFYDPIVVHENSDLGIQGTFVEANNSCVTGNWTDLGNNTGCLDTSAPILTIVNQTAYTNESLSYDIATTSSQGITNFSLSNNTNSTDHLNFSINSTGTLVNSTGLEVKTYGFDITATDIINQSTTEPITITVLQGTDSSTTEPTPDTSSDDDDDSGESSSSGGSTGTSPPSSNSPNCVDAYECTEWSACTDDKQTRSCTKVKLKCKNVPPEKEQNCTLDLAPEEPQETTEQSEEELEETSSSSITGRTIGGTIRQSFNYAKNNILIPIAILVIVIGFIITLVLEKKVKRTRLSKTPLGKKQPGAKDDSNKLWDWEEKKADKKKG